LTESLENANQGYRKRPENRRKTMNNPYTYGERKIVDRMQGESLKFYGMAGRGCNAPGCVVIRSLPDNTRHPFVVHFGNLQDGGYYYGDYCETREDAERAYRSRVSQYDRDGDLNRAFTYLDIRS
jgi:hypothetical protein